MQRCVLHAHARATLTRNTCTCLSGGPCKDQTEPYASRSSRVGIGNFEGTGIGAIVRRWEFGRAGEQMYCVEVDIEVGTFAPYRGSGMQLTRGVMCTHIFDPRDGPDDEDTSMVDGVHRSYEPPWLTVFIDGTPDRPPGFQRAYYDSERDCIDDPDRSQDNLQQLKFRFPNAPTALVQQTVSRYGSWAGLAAQELIDMGYEYDTETED